MKAEKHDATHLTPVIANALRAAGFRRTDLDSAIRIQAKATHASIRIVAEHVYFIAREVTRKGQTTMILVDRQGQQVVIPPSLHFCEFFY